MGLMAFALTVLVIANVAAVYIYYSRQALRRALNDDRPLWPTITSDGWRRRRRRAWLNPVSGAPARPTPPRASAPADQTRLAEPVAMSGTPEPTKS